MRRNTSWPPQWITGLVFLTCIPIAGSTDLVLLEHEPLAVRQLMQQASEFESAADTPDNDWQAAVRYCAASRLGKSRLATRSPRRWGING